MTTMMTDTLRVEFWQAGLMLLGLLVILMVLMWKMRHHQRAHAQVLALNASLAARVQAKEHELSERDQRLERLAREQARTAERSRILRDMHDGVGAHLSAAIRQVESGRSSPQDILDSLKDSMEQLKLSIDALNLLPGDVSTLLANLRYRLSPRFAASDLALHWDVAQIEPLPYLDSTATRHLQFMLYEALSNVFQHSQATQLHISLYAQGEAAVLRLMDNGVGFEVPELTSLTPNQRAHGKAEAGQGLRSMVARAQTIRAQLHLRSQPGNTTLTITLKRPPNERRAKARAAGSGST